MDHFREDVDAATRDLKDAKVKVKTDFDRNGDMVHDLDKAVENASKNAKAVEPKIQPKIDEKNFQAQLRAVKAQARLSDAKMNISFDDKMAESKLEAEILKLKAIAKAQDIKLKISEDDGGRGGGGFGKGLGKGFDFMPNIGGLGGFPSLLLIVGVLSLLAPALSLLSQALVGLPALIAGVALPIGVFALGIGGIKKALDDSGILKDDQKYDKHGKPVGKDKQGLGTSLSDIKKQISDVFEQGLTPALKNFAGVLPQLLRGLPFVAQGITTFATSLMNSFINPKNIEQFDRFTNSVGTMMTNLAPGIQIFTNAMIGLVTNVGDHLPGLGTTMTLWADQFQNWVTKISKPQNFWGQDIANSSTLDKAVQNMKPILDSVKDFVGDLFGKGLDLASTGKMANNIKDFINSLTNFATTTLPALTAGFDKIAGFMRTVGLVDPPKPMNPYVSPGYRPPPTATHADVAPKPTDGPHPGGPKTGFDAIGQWWKGLGLGFTDTGGTGLLGTLLKNIFGGGIGASGQASAAPAPFNPGKAVGQPQQPQQQVQSPKVDMNGVAQSIQGGAGAIAAAANAAFKALSDAATVAVSQCVQAVQQLPGAIAQALAGVGPAGAAAGQALGTGMAGGIAASAPAAIAAAHALAQGVTAAAHTTLEINSPSKVFHRIGLSVGEGFQDGITASFGDFNGIPWPLPGKNKVKLNSFPDKWAPWDESETQPPGNFNPGIKIDTSTTTSSGVEWLEDGKNASKGFGRGLTSGAPFVAEAAQGVAGSATDALRAALGIRSPSVVFHGLGQNTAQGFQDGLEGGFQGVLDSAKNLTQQVTDAVANHSAGPQLKNQIKQQLDAIDVEKEQLRADAAGTSDKGQKRAIKGQIDQLNIAKDQLKIQGTQLGYSDKFGSHTKDTTKEQQDQLTIQQDQLRAQLAGTKDKEQRRKLQQQIDGLEVQKKQLKLQKDQNGESDNADDKLQKMLGGSVNKMVDIGKNFAMSNINQFESDVGISGQGAIPTLANLGLNWGTQMLNGMVTNAFGGGQGKTEIHVNSVDEALAAKQTTDNRRALTHHAGR